ncbi:lysophospholipid acyltransferase family protein [Cryptosporangium japonicum]|uniref:Phospholipid/glycerol acyltransferase domain-containing protein n=1 Tax=Cryptosporangium japonicum TaxID=80872 RepID=A0ABP3DEW4_9ACTN
MPDAQIIPFDGGNKAEPVDTTDQGMTANADAGSARESADETVTVEVTRASSVNKAPATKAPAKKAPAKKIAKKAVKKAAKAPAGKPTASGRGRGPATAPAAPRPASAEAVGKPAADDGGAGDVWDRRVAGALAFVRRRLTGEYETDEFGFDPEFSQAVLAPALRPLYEKWFRVEISGLEHVSDTGGALVVANHSGTIPVDATMLQLGLLDHHPAQRKLRLLAADLVFQMPFVGELARKSGSTLACQPDAERLLSSGELVGVFPEGFKGVGKPFSERYKLQRFGRGGFVSAALATKAPIIPCAIVGAEEIYPKIGDAKVIARMFGLPYFPLTPTFPWLGPLGAVPLPSKWYIEFGEPIETSDLAAGADDPMQVFNLTDQVRETIQQMLYQLLMRRPSVFG